MTKSDTHEVDMNQVETEAKCLISKIYGKNVPSKGFVRVTVNEATFKVHFIKYHEGWTITKKEKL